MHFANRPFNDPTTNPSVLNENAPGPQGVCRTFAFWDADSNDAEHVRVANALSQNHPHTQMSCVTPGTYPSNLPDCDSTHPVVITQLSDEGAHIFRQSSFLFARKFESWVLTQQQFRTIIL